MKSQKKSTHTQNKWTFQKKEGKKERKKKDWKHQNRRPIDDSVINNRKLRMEKQWLKTIYIYTYIRKLLKYIKGIKNMFIKKTYIYMHINPPPKHTHTHIKIYAHVYTHIRTHNTHIHPHTNPAHKNTHIHILYYG